MNHKTDMREALQLCVDAMLHDGVPTDPYHPRRVALTAAEDALASRPDAQENLASENVAKDSPPKVSQGPAQADEREAFAMWWKDISPSNFDYASALAGYLAGYARAAAPQAEAAQGVPDGWKLVPVERSYDMRAKAIIAFNTAEHSGKDRDDAMDAAWRAMIDAAPSPDREQVGEAAEAARIVKMWDDGFTQLAGSRAVELLRNASPSRECGETQGASAVVRDALEAAFEERNGWRVKVAAAVREAAPAAHNAGAQEPVAILDGWMLVKRERIEEIRQYARTEFVNSYLGRNLYDERSLMQNERIGEEALSNIRDVLSWIEEDEKDRIAAYPQPMPQTDAARDESPKEMLERMYREMKAMGPFEQMKRQLEAIAARERGEREGDA